MIAAKDGVISREAGPQPLAEIMQRLGLTNDDLVRRSTQQLTHKMVHKGCKGRRVSRNVQYKILDALCALKPDQNFTLKDLFTY
ncbi:MAG: hypothetical protein NTU66_08255 [Elusimicrobia bacterium]|nr:hypothetical protein [Elusimicrobiota bacterium]